MYLMWILSNKGSKNVTLKFVNFLVFYIISLFHVKNFFFSNFILEAFITIVQSLISNCKSLLHL